MQVDPLLFYLGRRHSDFVLRRHPAWKRRIEAVERKLERYRNLFLVPFRFLYGLRTVTAFMVGMSSVRVHGFFILNILGAILWIC
jgi:membrane protein DedA with SNARE-associated domain